MMHWLYPPYGYGQKFLIAPVLYWEGFFFNFIVKTFSYFLIWISHLVTYVSVKHLKHNAFPTISSHQLCWQEANRTIPVHSWYYLYIYLLHRFTRPPKSTVIWLIALYCCLLPLLFQLSLSFPAFHFHYRAISFCSVLLHTILSGSASSLLSMWLSISKLSDVALPYFLLVLLLSIFTCLQRAAGRQSNQAIRL